MRLALTGKRFGRLTVGRIADVDRQGRTRWYCRCSCGNRRVVVGGHLNYGATKSCGCLMRERTSRANTTHGHRRFSLKNHQSIEYTCWTTMIQRCTNPGTKNWKNYGGRGISVCRRWRSSFCNFLADMGLKPNPALSIDRINNDKGYYPSNCRWATRSVQCKNQRPRKRRAI